jgi:predicted DCC family thiol-disulfide oxidoreductase YuxK
VSPRVPLRQRLIDTYLSIDPRSLGFGRIVLAIVLLVDLLRRVPDIGLFYSNHGMLPNHTILWRPPTQWMFSLFFMASWTDEAVFGFVLCGLVYLVLLVGWRTRLMQVLALIAVMSLHSRVPFLENGGDWTLGELALWTTFLPLGRRFSVDAVLASLRARRERTAVHLNSLLRNPQTGSEPPAMGSVERSSTSLDANRAALEPSTTPVVSLAVLAVLLQLSLSYFFNCIQKGGPTWRSGAAVGYVIHQDRMVTWFGVWLRPHMSLALSRVLSWSALVIEGSLPVLILSPVFRTATRRAAVLCIIGLHVSFQFFINLGIFSWAMVGYTPYLLGAADWALFAGLERERGRPVTAYFDAGCGVCFQIARLLARLDRFGRVRLLSSAELDPMPEGVTPELLARTIVVVDDRTGRWFTRADGFARILSALPVGFLWAWPLRLPGVRALANAAYSAFARRRETISVWLGLAACSLPPPAGEAAPAPETAAPPAPAPIVEKFLVGVRWLREAGVVMMIVVLFTEALMINEVVPRWLRPEEPLLIKELVAYPRLIQAWSMFASDAPTTDETVVVDAVTVEGRHVDPYSEVAGRYPNPGASEIPPRLDNDSFFFNYSARIPFRPEYFGAFEEWILAYPDRTGRPQDRIVRFDAYIVEDDSPPPGQTKPRNVRKRVFLSFPHS